MGPVSKKSRHVQGSDTDSEDYGDMEHDNLHVDEEVEEEEEEDSAEQNDARKNAEMEELEKEYMDLRHKEQDILENLKRHKDEDLLKGQAVKNQKALWDKTLELRFLLQKAFSNSNRLPQEPLRSSFCDLEEGAKDAYSDLIASSEKALGSLLELQEALLEKNPSISQSTDGNFEQSHKHLATSSNLNEDGDEEWSRVSKMQSRLADFRNKSIDKWHRKTQVTTGVAAFKGKFRAFDQNISDQVATYMRDPTRMIKGMQLRRSTVNVFGTVPDTVVNTEGEDINANGDPELLDDSEFYQQLLKEFLETFDPTSSETAKYTLKRANIRKRKVVDRRATKSRKIRYTVHEKIVNFMAPQPMDLPPMAPKLFQNLFGLKSQKSASVA